MKKTCFVVTLTMVLYLATWTCSGSLTLYNGFVVLNPNGSGNTFYDTDTATGNPDFTGTLFTISQGQTIRLGGEVRTTPGNGAASGADFVRIYYSVDNGAFNFVNLSFQQNVGNDDQWHEVGASMAEIGSGLSVGTHSLSVYFFGHDNTDNFDGFLNNGGVNYSASIQVVPEPVNVALGIFGASILCSLGFRRLFFRPRS
jgi:hypothetical protein